MVPHLHVWKRRIRNAPSATRSDTEITLSIEWLTEENAPALPTVATRKDPLLWSIWTLKTGWVYKVSLIPELGANTEWQKFTSEREALADYKRKVKQFPRSKEVDYGFPLDDSPAG